MPFSIRLIKIKKFGKLCFRRVREGRNSHMFAKKYKLESNLATSTRYFSAYSFCPIILPLGIDSFRGTGTRVPGRVSTGTSALLILAQWKGLNDQWSAPPTRFPWATACSPVPLSVGC